MPVERLPFGSIGGHPAGLFRLDAGGAVTAAVSDYGAALVSLTAPDHDGRAGDIVLGFDRAEDYRADDQFLGVVVGRYANRIAGGRFTLDGVSFDLPRNDGRHHLHGGPEGFHRRPWSAEPLESPDGEAAVRLSLVSPDGDQGYPGTLTVSATYTLFREGRLRLEFSATTDRPTVVSLASHAYFNLDGGADILDHRLTVHAGRFCAIDAEAIPTGALVPVADTPFDLHAGRRIGDVLACGHPQLTAGRGLDHCFAIDGPPGRLRPVAELEGPVSGRRLAVLSTQPGVQVYSGNNMHETAGKQSRRFGYRSGVCLETQSFPDAPNRPVFPDTCLRPGQTYRQSTEFVLS